VWCATPCLSRCERELLAELLAVPEAFIFQSEPWTCRAADVGQLTPHFLERSMDVYFAGLLVSMLQMVGGVSTILPMNTVEYIWFFGVILVGTVLFAAIQGFICGVVTNGDPDETDWVQKNDQLNAMMADMRVPQEARMFVRGHFRKAKKLRKRQAYGPLLSECLSQELQGDIRYYMCQALFAQVWYLAPCERSFLEDLSNKLTRESYAPKEPIACDETLIVITMGTAARAGNFMTAGTSFGDIILSNPVLRDTTEAKAFTYTEVAKLERNDLYDVLADYPDSAKIIREASLKLALQRTILIVSVVANADKSEGAAKQLPVASQVLEEILGGQYNSAVDTAKSGPPSRRPSFSAPAPSSSARASFGDGVSGGAIMQQLKMITERLDTLTHSVATLEQRAGAPIVSLTEQTDLSA